MCVSASEVVQTSRVQAYGVQRLVSRQTAKQVLQIEAQAILSLIDRLDGSFDRALDLLAECRGRVVITGVGKSGIVCRKIAATLASTGTPALFLHPLEALHGDLGILMAGDVVMALSNSGETAELLRLLETLERLGVPLIALVGDPESTLARHAEVVLDVSVEREACPFGLAPTASTTAGLALGDALALALSERKGFALEDFARLHPGGVLGKKLARVADLMRTGDSIPVVSQDTPMDEVIYEMSRKGLGITSVVNGDHQLVGVISDGDLRRLLQSRGSEVLSCRAGDCMTPDPVTISAGELATRALNLMETRKITALMVTGPGARLGGIIHLHHLWGTEMF